MTCPLPRYYFCHAAVATGIMAGVAAGALFLPHAGLLGGAAAGAAFYAGREVRDREKLGEWDWKGLAAPVLACVALYTILALTL